MRSERLITGAVVLWLAAGAYEYAGGQAVLLEQGATVFVSARLESMRKSLGPTVVARVAYENVGFAVQHSEPYVTEACSALQVVKHVPREDLLRTRDARGMRHAFVGDWTARLHATEQQCKTHLANQPRARVLENRKVQYELQ